VAAEDAAAGPEDDAMIGSTLPRWWFSLLSTFSGLALLAGCERPAAPPQAPPDKTHTSGTTGWNPAIGAARVPGIDQATVHWYARDGRVIYVVWSDLAGGPGSAFGHGVTATPGQVRQDARLLASDGRHLDLQYERGPEEGVEVVRCGGGRHPLSHGRFLLVSGLDACARVVQVPLDSALADLLTDPAQSEDSLRASLRAYARRNPDLSSYFAGRAAPM
jgi:hypothetical protein